MRQAVPTQCKFCGQAVLAQWDTEDQCPTEWMDKLFPMLCCNLCADVRKSIRSLEHEFTSLCVRLTIRCDRSAVEERLRHIGWKLGVAYGLLETSNVVKLAEWQLHDALTGFVHDVMDRPEGGLDLLHTYRRYAFDLATGKICNRNSAPSETPSETYSEV